MPRLSFLRLLPVIYLALWSTVFGLWSFFDGEGLFALFGLDLTGDPFVFANSGARYLGIAAALWAAIIIGQPVAVYVALTGRFVMDLFDVVGGIRTGVLSPILPGLIQSAVLFFLPAALGVWLAWRAQAAAR